VSDAGQDEYFRALGANVAAQRKRMRMTQDQLARRVGLARSSVTNIEAGRQQTGVDVLARLAVALFTTTAKLLPPDPEPPGCPAGDGCPFDPRNWGNDGAES